MPSVQSKDPQLFVHLAWETCSAGPALPDDEFQQATHLAIQNRLRFLCCHLIAIGSSKGKTQMVAHFPASLPISAVACSSYSAATEAITRLHELLYGTKVDPETLWSRNYAAQTLPPMDAAQARAYLQALA